MCHLSKAVCLFFLLASCGGGGSDPQPMQFIPRMAVETHHQLFGPVQHEGAIKDTIHGATFVFPGSALTASTKIFHFSKVLNPAELAQFEIVWDAPNTNHQVRLVYFNTTGPRTPVTVCEFTPEVIGFPRPQICDFLTVFNTLALAREDKQFGWMVRDDGLSTAIFYEARITIVWSAM